MEKILTLVPHICEGNDADLINELSDKLRAIDDLTLLDVSMDTERNRTIFAFTGSLDALYEGGFLMYEYATKHVDMRNHKGAYPRIGAIDVCPFVPMKDVTIQEASAVAEKFAEMVAEKFKIPVYLYAEAAKKSLRRDIENIRKGEYEGLEEKISKPVWSPDFGPAAFIPDFGATIIGARYPQVTFKIHLNTKDVEITEKIASSLQFPTGGLQNVSAYPGIVAQGDHSRIVVRVTNYDTTPVYKVLELAKLEAQRYGVRIMEVEMMGLVPEKALLDSALFYMNINNFSYENISEKNIQKHLK